MDKSTKNEYSLEKNVNKNKIHNTSDQFLSLPNCQKIINQNQTSKSHTNELFSNDKGDILEIHSDKSLNNDHLGSIKKISNKVQLNDNFVEEDALARGLWEDKFDFIFGCISYAVGLGNVWRFPYLCYENGGGAFLLPWFLCIILCGIPLFVLEVSLGQFLNTGGVCIWNLVPIFKGIGYASMTMIGLCNIYYIVLIAWTIYYFAASFQSPLPWLTCNTENKFCINKNWQNASSILFSRNLTLNDSRLITPVKNYWENQVLEITDGIHNMGTIRWPLAFCLLIAWLLVYMVIWRGLHKSGKIIWITACFPYLILFILFLRGITLDGAYYGLEYLFTPRWEKLKEARVWVSAATQVLFSYGIGIGANIALGSYNRYHHNFYRDSLIACCISSSTSLFSAIVIFSVIGHMAFTENKLISEVAQTGPGLAFLAYPEIVIKLPFASFWSILFFLMLIILGTDSQFCTVEAFVTGIVDEYARYLRPRRKLFTLIVCLISFMLGLPLVMNGGMYLFTLMDFFSASGFSLLTVVFCEIVGLCWIYGSKKLHNQMIDMLGFNPNNWIYYCWTYTCPLILVGLFTFSILRYESLTYANIYTYPIWGEFIGWCMGMASVICIPTYAILYICRQNGTLKERILKGFTSVVLPRKETDTAYIDDDISAMDVVVKDNIIQNNPNICSDNA